MDVSPTNSTARSTESTDGPTRMADLPRETVVDGVTAIRADLVPPVPVELKPESPRFDTFWLIAANVAGYPSFQPQSFEDLSQRSDVRFIGKIVSLSPETEEKPFGSVGLIVRPEEGPVDGSTELRVVFSYPQTVTSENAEIQVPGLPTERVLWLLKRDPATGEYYCTQHQFCAFVDTDQGVRSATAPNSPLQFVWGGFDPSISLDELARP
ncbi:hypothetical protein FDO65_11450 [Nakamurella flava]|uniref:Uncharacterized protein n=1 Tax=Nakamurella flava TaxID=2576308 RepID=A0A4U6QG20_9ACTN|nr:hypothetical protein [Nakamurella flava]TKV59234.1 hypothetical protein FDO65_11450 [Nakamurella flava]